MERQAKERFTTLNDFDNKVFCLLGFLPPGPSTEPAQQRQELKQPDAQSEEWRRRLVAERELEQALRDLGARVTIDKNPEEADYIVVPQSCHPSGGSNELGEGVLEIGPPVISDTVLLESIVLPYHSISMGPGRSATSSHSYLSSSNAFSRDIASSAVVGDAPHLPRSLDSTSHSYQHSYRHNPTHSYNAGLPKKSPASVATATATATAITTSPSPYKGQAQKQQKLHLYNANPPLKNHSRSASASLSTSSLSSSSSHAHTLSQLQNSSLPALQAPSLLYNALSPYTSTRSGHRSGLRNIITYEDISQSEESSESRFPSSRNTPTTMDSTTNATANTSTPTDETDDNSSKATSDNESHQIQDQQDQQQQDQQQQQKQQRLQSRRLQLRNMLNASKNGGDGVSQQVQADSIQSIQNERDAFSVEAEHHHHRHHNQLRPQRPQSKASITTSDTRSKATDNDERNIERMRLFDLADNERRERSDWQEMLTAALTGEVVDSEKKRINTQPENILMDLNEIENSSGIMDMSQKGNTYHAVFKHLHYDLWVHCRASVRGRTVQQEKQMLESLRATHADPTIKSIMDFVAEKPPQPADLEHNGSSDDGLNSSSNSSSDSDWSADCLAQLMRLFRRLDLVEGLYPTFKALAEAKPLYASKAFQEKLGAMTSWTTHALRLSKHVNMLKAWTGSEDLNFFSTKDPRSPPIVTAPESGITSNSLSDSRGGWNRMLSLRSDTHTPGTEGLQHTPFVERLLKEKGLNPIFEQKMLTDIEDVLRSVRSDTILFSAAYNAMGLPVLNSNLDALLRFSPRLLQAALQIRFQSAFNLTNPAPAQINQLLDDFGEALSISCRVKRSFNDIAKPEKAWFTNVTLDPEYEELLHRSLLAYFRLLKLKLGNYYERGANKEFEILETAWPFLRQVAKDIKGGQYELALYFFTQMASLSRAYRRLLARMLKGPPGYDLMSSKELSKWINRAQQIARSSMLKGLRLLRTLQEALINSTDYAFNDPFPLLGQLVDTRHVLIYTAGEWESNGLYLIGSQALLQNPHVASRLLNSFIANDYLSADQFRNCYLLIVRTDADFNWTGLSIVPEEYIPLQDLALNPGQMRLISPGSSRLDLHRQWLERIGIASKRMPWDTAASVSEDIIEDYQNSRRRWRAKKTMESTSRGNRHGKKRASSVPSGAANTDKDSNPPVSSQHSRRASGAGSSSSRPAHDNFDDNGLEIDNSANGGTDSDAWVNSDIDNNEDSEGSDFDALRPSLLPIDKKLDRLNNEAASAAIEGGSAKEVKALALGKSSHLSAFGDGRSQAPAYVIELTRTHNPHIQRKWVLLKYTVNRMLDALTQFPEMARTLHIDIHERRFYEKQMTITRRSSERNRGIARSGSRHTHHHPRNYHSNQSDDPHSHTGDAIHSDGQSVGSEVPGAECSGANCDILEDVQDAYMFVSNTVYRAARFLDVKSERYMQLALLYMCVGWCGFITEDCMANEKRTFRWAVQALESTMRVSRHNMVQVLPSDEWELLKSQVAGCFTLMIGHFDILGARDEELRRKNKQREQHEKEVQLMRPWPTGVNPISANDPHSLLSLEGIGANIRSIRFNHDRRQHVSQVDEFRDNYLLEEGLIGRRIEVTERPEDQTLRMLAASKSNITVRWQLGRYIGGGAFGSVYVGYNLDTGELMAVKEIRFPARVVGFNDRNSDGEDSGKKIVREMEIMAVLQHPNIVTYYGIEVHREKVYLFMELCTNGSLAQLIQNQGKFDEMTTKYYVVQMLRGLEYLHKSSICHRDIKCDNTLLDENMNIKLVDFGAAKALDLQSVVATRRTRAGRGGATLTGTPMYMAPEVILLSRRQPGGGGGTATAAGTSAANGGGGGGISNTGDGSGTSANSGGVSMGMGMSGEKLRPGKFGAQDIWSLGCCIVEMITGKPPWAHLDNEWAIMYHIVAGNPPLPSSSDISAEGMDFIKKCFTRQPSDRPQAQDLLKHPWVASTARELEDGQIANKLATATGSATDFGSNIELMSAASIMTSGVSNTSMRGLSPLSESPGLLIGLDDGQRAFAGKTMSISSAHSISPGMPLSRSRASTINRKTRAGEVRFGTPSGSTSSAVDALHMAINPVSGGQNSPGSIRTNAYGSSYLMAHHPSGSTSALGTPGSVRSGSSHNAWPFNKDVPDDGMPKGNIKQGVSVEGDNSTHANDEQGGRSDSEAPNVSAQVSYKQEPVDIDMQQGQQQQYNSRGLNAIGTNAAQQVSELGLDSVEFGGNKRSSFLSPTALNGPSSELLALYSSPSSIYQALNSSGANSGIDAEGRISSFQAPPSLRSTSSALGGNVSTFNAKWSESMNASGRIEYLHLDENLVVDKNASDEKKAGQKSEATPPALQSSTTGDRNNTRHTGTNITTSTNNDMSEATGPATSYASDTAEADRARDAEACDFGNGNDVNADESSKDKSVIRANDGGHNDDSDGFANQEMIQDLSETTRKAMEALLQLPAEGADVSGVAGWLGEDNTPSAILDVREMEKTMATSSQIIVRQREQQIRREKEMRMQKAQRDIENSDTSDTASYISPNIDTRTYGFGYDNGVDRLPSIDGASRSAPGYMREMTEPPALYPLPPQDDTDSESGDAACR